MEAKEDLENGVASHEEYDGKNYNDANGASLRPTPTNVTLSSEQFERLYLSPQNRVNNDLRKTFGNPTPLALLGFSVGLTPLSAEFLGWRGAGGGGNPQATVGATIWFGGALLLIAGLMEWILGNTFPFIVFMGYGCHFLTVATTLTPFYGAISSYTNGNPFATGSQEQTPVFAASFAFYPLSLGILSFVYLICSLRTNLVFFLIFVVATIGFGLNAGAYWNIAQGNMELGSKLVVGTGACFWAASMLGWYMLLAVMIPVMELPLPALPIVDLSTKIRPKGKRTR